MMQHRNHQFSKITLKKLRQFILSSIGNRCDGSVCCDWVVDVTCDASKFTAVTDDDSCGSSGGDNIAGGGGSGGDVCVGGVFLLTLRFPDMANTQLNCADNTSIVPFIHTIDDIHT